MILPDVLQALTRSPLQYKAEWVGEHPHEPHDEPVVHLAQFVELVAHVSIALDQFCGTALLHCLLLDKYLDGYINCTFIRLEGRVQTQHC